AGDGDRKRSPVWVRIFAPCRHYLLGAEMKDIILILTALCLAASGQTRTAVAKGSAAHQRTVVMGRPGASDAAVERTIRSKFAASKIAPNKFTVHVQGG